MFDTAKRVLRQRVVPWLTPADSLPDFIIVGAQKSGTTWLAHLVGEQKTILKPTIKEINYFDDMYHLGKRWYMSHFPPASQEKSLPDKAPTCMRYEATPDYLFDERAPIRISKDLPNVKIIAVMRDPVGRAVSGYHHMVNAGLEKRPFSEAIRREDTFQWRDRILRPAYIKRGVYADQIERYQQHFPAKQIHLMVFEDLIATPDLVLKDLSSFLETPLELPADRKARNQGQYEFEISKEDEAYIRQMTDESSAKVFSMLDRPRIW